MSTARRLREIDGLALVCADIGSVKNGNFAWYERDGASALDPSSLARQVAAFMNAGRPVALGFECPLFVPLPDDDWSLGSARPGEGARAWSAGAGCGALSTGLVQVAWVLRAIRAQLDTPGSAHLAWDSFSAAGRGLLVWEAFVSGGQKGVDHLDDARLAVAAFESALPDPAARNAIQCASEVYSLAGAALLRAGWSTDVALLSQPCLVIKGEHGA